MLNPGFDLCRCRGGRVFQIANQFAYRVPDPQTRCTSAIFSQVTSGVRAQAFNTLIQGPDGTVIEEDAEERTFEADDVHHMLTFTLQERALLGTGQVNLSCVCA